MTSFYQDNRCKQTVVHPCYCHCSATQDIEDTTNSSHVAKSHNITTHLWSSWPISDAMVTELPFGGHDNHLFSLVYPLCHQPRNSWKKRDPIWVSIIWFIARKALRNLDFYGEKKHPSGRAGWLGLIRWYTKKGLGFFPWRRAGNRSDGHCFFCDDTFTKKRVIVQEGFTNNFLEWANYINYKYHQIPSSSRISTSWVNIQEEWIPITRQKLSRHDRQPLTLLKVSSHAWSTQKCHGMRHVVNFALRIVSGYPRNEKKVHTQLLYLHCWYWRQESPKPPLTSSSSVKSTYIHRIVSSRIMQTKSIWQNLLALMTIWHHFQASLSVQRTLSYSCRSSAPLAIPTCPKDPLKIAEMTDSLMLFYTANGLQTCRIDFPPNTLES